jgi:LysR family transcriptional regulator, nod-box dependent transcriptional activator
MNLRRLDLNLLVTLHAVLRHRSVTRAAGELGMTQSGVSGELRHLRRVFGDQLLVRVGREWKPTPLAEQLTEPVSDIMRRIDKTVSHHATFDPRTSVREFSLVVSDYAMLVLVQPLVRRLGAEAPSVTLHLHPLTADLAEVLDVGGADLVMAPSGVVEGRPCRFLVEERWVCAVAADHPEVGDRIDPDLFERLPHLTYRWGVGRPALLAVPDQELARQGVHRRVQMTVESFALVPYMLEGTRLVAVVHERVGRRMQECARIKLITPPFSIDPLLETMYWNPTADDDPAHRWLRELLVEVAAQV